jgi:hypothetical protein
MPRRSTGMRELQHKARRDVWSGVSGMFMSDLCARVVCLCLSWLSRLALLDMRVHHLHGVVCPLRGLPCLQLSTASLCACSAAKEEGVRGRGLWL